MVKILQWIRGRTHKQPPVAASLYAESAAIYEASKSPGDAVYRDVRVIPSFEKTIVEHTVLVKLAVRCLYERKPFQQRHYQQLLIPKYQWFLTPDGTYLDVKRHWQELCAVSAEFLRIYEKESDDVDGIAQTNVYRLGPLADLVVTIAREVKIQDGYVV